MLSAVAARKAALAAQNEALAAQAQVSTTVASISQPTSPETPRDGSSKRKLGTQESRSETKKPKKTPRPQPTPKSSTKMKAKETDDFKEQADMIIVEDSDDEDSDSVGIVGLEEYDPEPTRIPPIRRAWSPSQPLEDSSDEDSPDGEAMPVDISSLFPHSSNSPRPTDGEDGILSTFEPVLDKNVYFLDDSELTLLGFSAPTTLITITTEDSLCLLGICKLTVVHGTLTLCGTTLPSSRTSHAIFAPRSSPLPILRAGGRSSGPSVLQTSNLSPRLQHLLLSRTVIAVQENRTGVEGLGQICRTFEGVFEPSRWQRSSATEPFGVPGLFMIRKQSKESHAFTMPSSWSDALSRDTNTAIAGTHIIKGPKNSGKSTFARTLMNHLLRFYRHVAYLECDIGQSEFSPGGMVSLNVISTPIFGPAFTHPTLPNYAHFIGSTTPRSNPSHYLDAVRALIEVYRLDIQTPAIEMMDDGDSRTQDVIPLVVNTMGWSKGLGADLTQNIENLIDATHIYDIQAPVREEYPVSVPAVPIGGTYGAYYTHSTMDASTAPVYILEPIAPFSTAAGYTAADHRTLSILSYFHAKFPLDSMPGELGQVTARSWDTTRPLCAVPPYDVDCAVALDRVVLTGGGSEDVVEDEIARVLNGALVGLVACEPGTVDRPVPSASPAGIPYTRGHVPPAPASSNCAGIALVRAVAPSTTTGEGETSGHLQMLTPLPHPLLAQARVLVKGEMELPVWGMLDFRNFGGGKDVDPGDVAGVEREKVAFLQWGKAPEGVIGAEKRRVRRNLMRRGQM